MVVSLSWLDCRAFTSDISRSSFSSTVVILNVNVGILAFFPRCRCCGSGGGSRGGGGGGVADLGIELVVAAVFLVDVGGELGGKVSGGGASVNPSRGQGHHI